MRLSEIRKHLQASLALILYLIVSLLYFGTTRNYSHRYLGIGNDPHIFIWCLNWWPWAITHGLKPFVSHYIWYPRGYNLTWATSVPAAALLMWPLTWLANPVVSFNVLSLVRGDLSRPRFVAAIAIATLVQLGFSTEILATSCFFGAIAWLIFLAFSAREERQRLPRSSTRRSGMQPMFWTDFSITSPI